MGKKLLHIEVLRIFAILCVILFHTTGMLKDKLPFFTSTPQLPSLMYCSALLVGIAVPLFMFIAGYLYKPVEKTEILSFIKKKAMRLWLPYCVFSLMIMFTSGFFEFKEIYMGNFYHLWFLPALFWCFIVSIWIDYSSAKALLILPIALVGSLLHLPALLGIQNFVQWFFFFALGAFFRYHAKFEIILKQYHLWIPLSVSYFLIIALVPFHYRQPSIIHAFGNSLMIVVIWYWFNNIKFLREGGGGILSIGNCSMGIYILHFWFLIYILSRTSFRIFHISELLQNFPVITVAVIVIITFVCCYTATLLLLRKKWGRFLLGC